MSEKRKAAGAAVPAGNADEELVEYIAPLDPGQERQEVLASVNGQTIRIRRGERVRIRRKFVKVLEASGRQDEAARRCMERFAH